MEFFETIYLTIGPAQYDGAAIFVAVLAALGMATGLGSAAIAFASSTFYQRLPAAIFATLCLAPSSLLGFALIRDTLAAFA